MSEPTAPENSCPKCGATLPSTATGGLCPRCLMAEAMAPTETDAGLVAHPPLPPEQIAPHFPQLEILECLGRGGMGVVYKARQKTLNRFVALKLLAPERVLDPQFAERFTREAQALAALNHPNIITIHDFGQAGGFYYLLMEFVDGANLRQLLRARKFTPEEALTIVPPLCDALQFAHERGIIHRDIKPENLLLDKAGRVKVADFGIAKILGTAGANDDAGPSSGLQNATQTGMGTPGYSAPEQKTDPQHVDSRADIYSLGVVFYELLTGELPGKRIEPPSHKVHIDVRLDEVVLRTLEQAPERRYQQASEVKTMLETIVQSPSPPVPPSPPAGGPNPISIKPKSKTMKTAITAIVVSAGALLVAGIAVCLFLTGDETIHIRSIPRDWSCLSGDASQWDWNDNTIYGHSTNGDSILASTKQYGDVTLSAMVSTTNREASLALRMQDADDGYVVIFGPDGTPTASWNGGHVWLIKRKSGNEQQLAMFNRRGLSAPGEREKLTVIAKGSWIEVRLNDVTIIRTNDATFKAGYIGLRVYGDSTYGCDGVFSNLTVRAKWLELRGGVETRPREITDEESRGTGSQTTAGQSSGSAPPAGLVELKEKWPAGKKFVLDYDLKQDTALLLQGRSNTVDETVTLGNRLRNTVVRETSDGGHELEAEFLGAWMSIKMGDDMILDYNSANPSAANQTNGVAAVFGNIVGSKLRYFRDANNDATQLEGVDELVQRIQSVPQTSPLAGDMQKMFSAAYFEQLTNANPFLPRHAVQPGDTWSSHSEQPVADTGIEVWDFNGVFQNWEMHQGHRCARLELQGILKVKPDPNSKRDEATYHARDGVLEGAAWFDPELGQMIEEEIKNDFNVDKEARNPNGPPGATVPGQTVTTQRHQVITIKLEM